MPRLIAEGSGKKKFGKNLNKLVKPSAPPIAQAAVGNQRNGLLLLSTQKKSSGGLLSKPAAAAHAIAPTSVLTPIESSASTHDFLLCAVTGKAEREFQPDAWGVAAEKLVVRESAPEITSFSENNVTFLNNENFSAKVEETTTAPTSALVNQGSCMPLTSESDDYVQAVDRRQTHTEAFPGESDEKFQTTPTTVISEKWDRPRSATHKLWEPNQPRRDIRSEDNCGPAVMARSVLVDSQIVEYDGPVIHLSSYDDRDRGERQDTTGPRMLYDPKSGSMVAVKVRDERRKLRARKVRKERVNGKSNEGKDSLEISEGRGKLFKANKWNEESTSGEIQHKERKKVHQPRLPRTCGVLYSRDESGQLRSADNCDGDVGYGAHSVPGGRINNPAAYSEFMKCQGNKANILDGFDDYYGTCTDGNDFCFTNDSGAPVTLNTGFSIDRRDKEVVQPDPIEWVKANDKLELVTGLDDSPTLKPTAKEWAPSQAAIAAAVAAARERKAMESSNESEDDIDPMSDSTESHCRDGSSGLGFDPTEDMHGLMRSPPSALNDATTLVSSVDFNVLQLDPPMYSTSRTETATAQGSIFAFGSSGTWGAKIATSSESDNWSLPLGLGSGTDGLFSSIDAFGTGKGNSTTTFMSFSDGGTSWVSRKGLGGLSLAGDTTSAVIGD